MEIQLNVNPPPKERHQRRYALLIETLKANTGWVAVSTNDIGGRSTAEKQSAVHQTCRRARLKIETRTTATHVFIRILKSSEVPNAQ